MPLQFVVITKIEVVSSEKSLVRPAPENIKLMNYENRVIVTAV